MAPSILSEVKPGFTGRLFGKRPYRVTKEYSEEYEFVVVKLYLGDSVVKSFGVSVHDTDKCILNQLYLMCKGSRFEDVIPDYLR